MKVLFKVRAMRINVPDKSLIFPGVKPVLDLLATEPERIRKVFCKKSRSGRELERMAELCENFGIPLQFVEAAELDALCASGKHAVSHQGVVAILAENRLIDLKTLFDLIPSSPLALAIALDQIQDIGNLGAIARSAYAMGCAGLILPGHGATPINAAANRASAGALGRLPAAVVPNLARALDMAEELDMTIIGSGCGEGGSCQDAFKFSWPMPAILVLGNEKKGIRPGVAKRCSIFVRIPFKRAFDSLNIAQACAMLLALCSAKASK